MLAVIQKIYLKKKFNIKKYYFLEKSLKAFLYLIESPIYFMLLPILFVIYVLRPVILIRWSTLHEIRIGSFASMNENYLCLKKSGINMPNQKFFDMFYFDKEICNKQLAKMWKRKFKVYPSFLMRKVDNLNKFLRYLFSLKNHIHEIKFSPQGNDSQRDLHLIWDRMPQALNFNNDEKINGQKILNKFGLKKDDKFVCLFVRDSAYLNRYHIPIPSKGSWDYAAYRDFDIDNFILASEEITKRGYYVFRLGKVAEKRINSSNPKIIDYAFSNLKSDFMDIYLIANCSFFLGTMSGIDQVAQIFRRPLAAVVVPPGMIQTNRFNIISILKHHFDKKTKKKLSLTEIFSRKLAFASGVEDYSRKNVELVENSSEEIKDLAIEMIDTIEGKKKYYDVDIKNQDKFWNLYRKNLSTYENNINHGKELRGKIAAQFLNKNENY